MASINCFRGFGGGYVSDGTTKRPVILEHMRGPRQPKPPTRTGATLVSVRRRREALEDRVRTVVRVGASRTAGGDAEGARSLLAEYERLQLEITALKAQECALDRIGA